MERHHRQKSIEDVIIDTNKEKFSQSFHTSFCQQPLIREFGFKGLTPAAQTVLDGLYDPHPNINIDGHHFLQELKCSCTI